MPFTQTLIPPRAAPGEPRGFYLTLAAALSLTLAACAAGPAAIPGTPDAPASASASADAAIRHTPWWQAFGDPLLDRLVRQALDANSRIHSAQASLQQARAQRDLAAAAAGPSLAWSASGQRQKTESMPTGSGFQTGLDAHWELDVFGVNRQSVLASAFDAGATQASLRDVQVSIAAEVALAYLQLRGIQAQLAIAQSNTASQQDTLQITRWRAQAGLIGAVELEQARSAAAQTAALIPALQSSLAQTRHSLALLTGRRPQELDPLLTPTAALPRVPEAMAQRFAADVLRQRADVRAAEQRVRAALARWRSADAARYPSFQLSGSLGLSALTLAGLTNGASVAGSLLGSVSWPVFDGGAAQSRAASQEAGLDKARADYQTTVLTALKEVQDALVALDADRQRVQQLEIAAESAQRAAELARQRFASGLIDFQTVLQTQRSLLGAQDSLASQRTQWLQDHVRLVKALGGGWSAEPPPGAAPEPLPPHPATPAGPDTAATAR